MNELNDIILVSAIVSTYKSEHFIRGCLEDLVNQSLYRQGKLEIIVIDSASPEKEGEIVREFQQGFPHIRYIRTAEREGLYTAWNRGVEAASGKYLTNANTDDRHRFDALEILSSYLERHTEIDLVYGDCYVSSELNETFEENDKSRRYSYPDYFAPAALLHYQFGPQPLWRRSVHDRIGMFDYSFRAAGDYDFNIRFAARCRALHVSEPLGLYLEHAGAISFRDETMERENGRIADHHKTPETALALYACESVPCNHNEEKAEALVDLGVRALRYYPPWKEGAAEANPALALRCFTAAEELVPGHPAAVNNIALTVCLSGNRADAEQLLAAHPDLNCDATLRHNLDQVRSGGNQLRLMPSRLELPGQEELAAAGPGCEQAGHDSPPLTICMVASVGRIDPFDSTGGLETAMRNTATSLAERGHRVALVGNLNRQPGLHNGVAYIPFDAWRAGEYPEFSRDADVLAFASGPDLRSYDVVPADIPKIALFHHQELAFLGAGDPLTLLNCTADAVICVSGAVRDNLARKGVQERKLHVVHNGIDHLTFHPRPVQREAHRILFVGALVPDKNVEMLIRAFLSVSPEFPGAELHLCGGASLWDAPEYIDRKEVARLSDRIQFHGVISHEELAEQYSRASICVIPSKFESFSLVSLEAQACGCVPLAAEVGGLPETMIPGITGFIYSPNDFDRLVESLRKLLAAPERVRKAGVEAQRFVAEKFCWSRTARQHEEIFSRALQQRPNKEPTNTKPEITAPKVSVIIPCYNYGRFLRDAVESVLSQTFQDFEIIIVNDGSTDDTVSVAERLIEEYPRHRVSLLNQANSGNPAVSRNRGIAEAQGHYILPLDADDMIVPTMLEECLKVLEHDQTVSIVYSDRLDFDGVDQIVQAGDYDFARLRYQNHISYCALFRRSVWTDVGGYRQVGCEDWDFWIAAGSKGHFGRRIPLPLFKYRRHDTGRFQKDIRNFDSIKARIILNNRACYSKEEVMAAESLLNMVDRNLFHVEPLVSVIVPTFNRPNMLVEAIESILNQTWRNFEIIVVNDAGADVEGIVSYLNSDGRITYVRHARNRGLAAARNTGIRLARGKYIAYLDDDDIYYPDHLETLVSFLEQSDNKVAYTDAHRAHQIRDRERYVIAKRDVPYSYDFDYDAILINNFVPVLCFMHEKKCIEDAGGFDETLTTHEDWDLWIRMSRLYRFSHVKKVTCEFTWRNDGSSMTSSKEADFLRTATIIYGKYVHMALDKPHVRAAQQKALESRQSQVRGTDVRPNDCSSEARTSVAPSSVACLDDEHTKKHLREAEDLVRSGKYSEALACFRTILDSCPDHTGALIGSGVVHLLQNELIKAAVAFSRVLRAETENSKALCGLAMVRNAQGRSGEAAGLYCRALDADPENLTALHELVKLAYATNTFAEAVSRLETYLMYHPGDPDMLFSLAGVLYKGGDSEKARETLERLLALCPDYEGARDLVNLISGGKGSPETAAKTAAFSLESARSLKEQGAYAEALQDFSGLLGSGDKSVLADMGDCLANLGKTGEAVDAFQQALLEDPNDLKALVGLGVLGMLRDDREQAAGWFERALSVDGSHAKALCGLGMVRNLQNRHAEASGLFNRALDADPEQLPALNGLVGCAYQLGLFGEAERRLADYLMYHPADLDMLFSLAGIRYKMGNRAAALESIETVLMFEPGYLGGRELMDMILEQPAA